MDVIILGSNHHNTLGLIHSLGEAGHTVYLLLLKSGFNYVNKSSYLKSWKLIKSFDEIIPWVKEIVSECETKPAMLVAGDEEATFVNLHFNELKNLCYLEGAYRNGDVVKYHDKFFANELADKTGFLIPQTWMIQNKDDLPINLRYPLIIKAGNSIRGGKGVLKKCCNADELKNILSGFVESVFPLQIQEYIQKEYELILLGCSLNHGEQVICPVAERKLRFYPQEFQTTAYTESLLIKDSPELKPIAEKVTTMIKSVGYTGLFSVELIHANNQFYYLETNFRNDGTGYLATVCGYNLPDILCHSFVGNSMNVEVMRYRPCHYINVIADGMNVIHRRVPFYSWIRQLKKANCYSHYSKKDILPLLYAIVALFVNKLK